jgi:pimeloyl-ACP methyl ester carboxylesterase
MQATHSQGTPFVLIPGAGGMASYWQRVVPLLEQAHREPIAVDLPGDDASASLDSYADTERWPQIPIRVIASADDRFFPLEFQRRVARERLDVDVNVAPGGPLVALSRPEELVELLLRFEREL